ncbi:PD-(D/E)XK nuclease family protein [Candidatus Saccharibacteria bacterium]|nr:PD-(D/E)XK nuclease family protein [Candidatus Saccharibacteria bacterium]
MNYWRERSQPYQPGQTTPFKVSRSKIELFVQCPRCFWLGTRLKITRPNTPPFNINKTIDELYKKEFDAHREAGTPHPIMTDNQIKAVPMQHDNMETWRHNFTGIVTIHKPTNLHVFGAIDDLWVGDDGKAIVVDYKATSKDKEVSIDADWQMSYKRQLEVYQWLLRQNGLDVSDTGYFVYTNARIDLDGFNDRLEFKTKLIPYTGSDAWVEPTLQKMKDCMEGDMPPVGQAAMGGDCDYCTYARKRTELTLKHVQKQTKANKK